MTEPKLANRIHIKRQGSKLLLEVDGRPFPWFTVGGIQTNHARDEISTVTITIPTDHLTVDDAR